MSVWSSPVEPPPSTWLFPPPDRFDPHEDLVALGADLEPGTLLLAYRSGLFPMPDPYGGPQVFWWSPVRRGVLPLDGLRVSRSLRRSVRDYEVRVDTRFEEVVRGCADPQRSGGWIDERIVAAYVRLHELGWAHSVEAWHGGELAGGLYGVQIGGLFAGESMFTRRRDASKAALVELVRRLSARGTDGRLLDVQWRTEHLATLGVTEVARPAYLALLERALRLPPVPLAEMP